ncbi:uncharacterized protein LOC130688756 [Daphnia carinata]|uniref:uncharacterized protein LOC130688756 n=1 Tax=Daphnia carinata TaxID=120202 RepID=UPI0028693373|nr:uncharacterized protein LOC130688756 [Daphnia carinata]
MQGSEIVALNSNTFTLLYIMHHQAEHVRKWRFYVFIIICGLTSTPATAITPEAENLIRTWSPLIWLHSEEKFLPSSVEFFLPEVTIQNNESAIVQEYVTPENLIGGEASVTLHMQTREPLDCPSCYNLDMFFGQAIENGGVPTYTIYREYDDAFNTLDVSYFAFYPYNRGKDACVGVPINGSCAGAEKNLGNHVGDWEHNALRFRNGQPYLIHLNVHSFGAYYEWNETTQNFQFLVGEEVRSAVNPNYDGSPYEKDARYEPRYPPTVELMGTHPIVYSANGSHGLWGSPDVHTYVPGLPLQDFTDEGTAWTTWDNLILIPWLPSNVSYEGNLNWLNFLGDWGNSAEGCEYEIITGECELGSGPSGPRSKVDFPDPQPKTSMDN